MSEIKNIKPIQQQPLSEKKNRVTEEKFREVSDMYEKYFIREMMKEMRATVKESGFIKKNHAEKIFQDQLDDQYADKWGKAGGIGLSQLIFDQLMNRYGEQYGLKTREARPQGPIDLTQKTNFTGRVRNLNENSTTFEITPQLVEAVPAEVKSPWAGILLDKKYLEMDQVSYRIQHDNGLESLIIGRGTGLSLSPGDRLQPGQQLGWLDSTSPVFWTIKGENANQTSE